MRVVIAGAGSVGRSIARELIENGHEVLLIDNDAEDVQSSRVPDASWLLADACELTALDDAGLDNCDVVVAATGDDKANLVVSLLAKTEFGVPRTVARVNNPKNEWLFDSTWGVDVAVSTPRLMTALIEEAVSVGDLVRIFEFSRSQAILVELTLPEGSPWTGRLVADVPWPADTVLTCLVREQRAIAPSGDDVLEVGDELILVTAVDKERELARLLNPASVRLDDEDDTSGGAHGVGGHPGWTPVGELAPDARLLLTTEGVVEMGPDSPHPGDADTSTTAAVDDESRASTAPTEDTPPPASVWAPGRDRPSGRSRRGDDQVGRIS
ncbi:putative potassium transporter [Mobilicoccus pelagius NBRC 104925]|uniref:Trk system potassium uptake protein TrkA n=1 Tax=Mobilicoccus pelagius NBRC 104925 TaxID=1089455 RepID=H5UUM3_9MICO|nr:putative potassium transporter [Mobilicoccus pelagius NBRC 104925]